ncbi:MAG TPA: HAMP domain-containing sensor histidine kinase [Propionibacteriaceae bacterium]|jgi:two-component system OmpR family sensor kinase|nr:HAMP domain-containing sensor histidine kinase [Propionibacteriaceae bacterium]
MSYPAAAQPGAGPPASVPPKPEVVPRLDPFGRHTLGRQLVIRVTALVALAALLITTATALATRQVLMSQLDRQLDAVTARVRDPAGTWPGGGPDSGLLRPGQPIGTLAVIYASDGTPLEGGMLTERGAAGKRGAAVTLLPDAAVSQLAGVPTDESKSSITLSELGHYRVVGFRIVSGTATVVTLVVGVPLRQVDETVLELVGLAALFSLLVIGGTVFAARSLVVRSLRPLNRVAATAQQVSQLKLDRGEVALAVRVPPQDANPDSEVGRVGQALNHMLNNVEEALAARQASETRVRQFVADASHELRNPLAAIRGYAELTRRDRERIPTDAAYAMSRVESEAERMSKLVEDMLLLARLDSGPALDLQPCDLSEIVINAVSDARAAGPDHVWQLNLPQYPVIAQGDQHRLYQVMINLLANARTHTPPGTQVRTDVWVNGTEGFVTVTDNGPGIPPEVAGRVFERFARGDASRKRAPDAAKGGSTGLGLAIVAAVVDAHHGTVSVTSQPGHTRFTVRLPLAPLAPAAHAGPGPDMHAPH